MSWVEFVKMSFGDEKYYRLFRSKLSIRVAEKNASQLLNRISAAAVQIESNLFM